MRTVGLVDSTRGLVPCGHLCCHPERNWSSDGRGSNFIDHRRLLVLAELAGHAGATVLLRTTWPGATRLVQLFDLKDVEVPQ